MKGDTLDYSTADHYQTDVARTMRNMTFTLTPEEMALLNYALGMAGEAGEAADLIKKAVFHRHELDKAKIAKEIGDVLWYCAALAKTLGCDLSHVMRENIKKLRIRFPEGFTEADSIARRDVKA